MKKFIILALAAVFAAAACEKTPAEPPVQVSVNLLYDGQPFETEGVTVNLSDLNGSASYQATTDASGCAVFQVLPGIYSASATYSVSEGSDLFIYNGINSNVSVSATGDNVFEINLVQS